MIVGTEWLIEAFECEAETLRDGAVLQKVFSQIIADLGLKTIGEPLWHKFGGAGGVTGLVMLTESHLACHTYPENGIATFNLYCCRTRPEWNWKANLTKMLGSGKVKITKIERGNNVNSQDFPQTSFGEVSIRERGRLPHWEKENGIYFVTFRLADSLPQDILEKLKAEREQTEKVLANLERELSPPEKRKIDWLFSEKADEYLDKNFGECYLGNPQIAEMVADALRYFDGERYHLFAWCVMPNHIHVVFRAIQKNKLDEILHSWKSFTANKANKLLNLTDKFWQREYYDHLVRTQEEFEQIIQYILDNPLKAGLKDYRWVGSYGKYKKSATM